MTELLTLPLQGDGLDLCDVDSFLAWYTGDKLVDSSRVSSVYDDFGPVLATVAPLVKLDGDVTSTSASQHASENSHSSTQLIGRERKHIYSDDAPAKRHKPVNCTGSDSVDSVDPQRLRNRRNSRRSRQRKVAQVTSLHDRLQELQSENTQLRKIISNKITGQESAAILSNCTHSTDILYRSPGGVSNDTHNDSIIAAEFAVIRSVINMQKAFIVMDITLPTRPIVYASDAFCLLTEYNRAALLGNSVSILYGANTSNQIVESLHKTALVKSEGVAECWCCYRADGTSFWNNNFVTTLRDRRGKPVQQLSFHCDVSARASSDLKDMRCTMNH